MEKQYRRRNRILTLKQRTALKEMLSFVGGIAILLLCGLGGF